MLQFYGPVFFDLIIQPASSDPRVASGIHMDFPPYSYHTPPVRSMSNHFMTPGCVAAALPRTTSRHLTLVSGIVEEAVYSRLKYADLVVYQVRAVATPPPL